MGYGNAPVLQDSLGVWGQPQPTFNNSAPTVFGNSSGTPSWTSQQPGWNQSGPTPSMQTNIWDSTTPAQATSNNNSLFDAQGIWGSTGTSTSSGVHNSGNAASLTASTQKKDDAFSDIWGGFK